MLGTSVLKLNGGKKTLRFCYLTFSLSVLSEQIAKIILQLFIVLTFLMFVHLGAVGFLRNVWSISFSQLPSKINCVI